MYPRNLVRLVVIICSLPLFTACGGGGNSDASSPSEQGSASPEVIIFSNPTGGQYASLGSSTTSAGDGYFPVAPDARLTDISLDASLQPMLRYTSSGNYEVKLPGADYDLLVHYDGLYNPTSDNNFFQPSKARQNEATFMTSLSRFEGYRYSELASWSDGTSLDRVGYLAFGTPTRSGQFPTSGSASYNGRVAGLVDITYADNLYGGSYFTGASGTIEITVDFATRSIEGTISIDVEVESGIITNTFPISSTPIPPDIVTWSGYFETPDSGLNQFKVRLTGPDASELIGSWAIPITIEGEPHQLMGAWIAARD